jgi:hypothetical protein
MSVSIRTTMANGKVSTDLYATESDGRRVLEAMLELHRKRGNAVRLDCTVYFVTDGTGKVVQTAEVISSI